MTFDFAKAQQEAKKDLDNNKLFLLLLGPSSGGKSFIQGTYGLKTLYLYTGGESHGPKAAATRGLDNIVPIRLDVEDGKDLSADAAMVRLHAILDDTAGIKKAGFKAVVLDGASELEAIVRNTTKFKAMTTTDAGKHNGFAEGPATIIQFRDVLLKLKRLRQDADCHICVTCILVVKELADDGTILDSMPQLQGYSVASTIIPQFDDVLVVGRMVKGEKADHRLQLLARAAKSTSTGASGQKTFNFGPRITGVDILALPATLKADLSEIIKLKAKA